MSIGVSRERKDLFAIITAELATLQTSLAGEGIAETDSKGVLDDIFNGVDMERNQRYFEEKYGSSDAVEQILCIVHTLVEQHGDTAVKASIEQTFGAISKYMYM